MEYKINFRIDGNKPPFTVTLHEDSQSNPAVLTKTVTDTTLQSFNNTTGYTISPYKEYCIKAVDSISNNVQVCDIKFGLSDLLVLVNQTNINVDYANIDENILNNKTYNIPVGENVTLTALSLGSTVFTNWETIPSNIISNLTNNPITFNMPSTNFSIKPLKESALSNLTIVTDGTNVNVKYLDVDKTISTNKTYNIPIGTNIDLSAIMTGTYIFDKWTTIPENIIIDLDDNPINFNMPQADFSITPHFYYSGSINKNFNVGIGADRTIRKIIKNSDSKYVLVGDFTYFNGDKVDHMVTLNEDGSRAPVSGGMFNKSVTSIIEDLDGNYVIGGFFTTYAGQKANRIIKVNRTMSRVGVLDFAAIGFDGDVEAIIQDSNGKYVIIGDFRSYTYDNGTAYNYIVTYNCKNIIRLNINGFPDNTFNVSNIPFDYPLYTIIQDNDGNYVVGGTGGIGGTVGGSGKRMVKLNQNGEVINDTYIFDTTVCSILEDGDSYLVGGEFDNYYWDVVFSRHNLIKINKDGMPSRDFEHSGKFLNINRFPVVRTIIKDSNDKYIIGGEFDRIGTETITNDIRRLNIDGSVDNTFIGGYGFDGESYGNLGGVYDILEDGDSYLVCGGFKTYQGETVNRIVKIYK